MWTRRLVTGARASAVARAAVVLVLLAAVFAARALAGDAGALGIGLFYLVPTLMAALWFGRAGGVATGALAAGLYGVGGFFVEQEDLVLGVLVRLAVFCSTGYGFARVLGQVTELRGTVADRDREIDQLRAMQEALVPAELPRRPMLELASCYVPAQHGVGGDFYIVLEAPDEATVLVVGDVVGKGIEAARRASFVRAALSTFAPFTDDPCRLLDLANTSLIEKAGASEQFVTAACVTFRPRERSLAWAVAGHPPPMLLDDGRRLNGTRPAIPLGIDVDIQCERGDVELPPGSGVLLFTDGLSEARRPRRTAPLANGDPAARRREFFGSGRIADLLAAHRGSDPTAVVRALRAAAEDFAGGALDDDLCMVAVRTRA